MSNKKILIIEDELLIGRVLKLVLEKRGFEVVHLNGPNNLMEEYKSLQPDVVVMDVSLNHDQSGVEVAHLMRENGCVCPIVFTTGNSYNQTKELISEINNTYLFIKPVDSDKLADFISDLK